MQDLLPYIFSFVDQDEWKYLRQQNRVLSLTNLHRFCKGASIRRVSYGKSNSQIWNIRWVQIKCTKPQKRYQIIKEYSIKNKRCTLDDSNVNFQNYIKYTSFIVIEDNDWSWEVSWCKRDPPVQKINPCSRCEIC